MNSFGFPRWAVSLADLALLLLGFFVILYSGKPDLQEVARSVRVVSASAAPSTRIVVLDVRAASLFEPGEARLTPRGRLRLVQIGGDAAAGGARLDVATIGLGEATERFDAWELGAARAAAAARALKAGGIAQDRVQITIPASEDLGIGSGQRLVIHLVH